MEFCLNLCDYPLMPKSNIEPYVWLDDTLSYHYNENITRIYVGSYICQNWFNKTNLMKTFLGYCNELEVHVTLVVPIISQVLLEATKHNICKYLNTYSNIDEVVVNDMAMLQFVHDNCAVRTHLGRLFCRDTRDIRVADNYINDDNRTYTFDPASVDIPFHGVELDLCWQKCAIPESYSDWLVCVHTPLTYQACGRFCNAASTSKPITEKFRANAVCKAECNDLFTYNYKGNHKDTGYYKIGRGVYFKHQKAEIENNYIVDRDIHFPLEFLLLRMEDEVVQ